MSDQEQQTVEGIPEWLLKAGENIDYTIPDVAAPDKSADEIEDSNKFDPIPPGEHEVMVVGFLKFKGTDSEVKVENKEAFIAGHPERITFKAASVNVKFGLVGNLNQQVTDMFMFPPSDPAGLNAYYNGSLKTEGKGVGLMANKFFHFIERLGFPYPKGGSLPPEARRISNWIGRRIRVKVIPGTPYYDQASGRDKPGRNQIELFSYAPAGPTQAHYARAAELAAASGPIRPAAAPVRPAAAPARPVATMPAGLDNI